MKKAVLMFVTVMSLITTGLYAVDETQSTRVPSQTQDTPQQILSKNIQVLQNERIRALVLQDVAVKEGRQLEQMEEQFCKNYNLDVDKFRKGLYKYDPDTNKFVETPASVVPTPAKASKKNKKVKS